MKPIEKIRKQIEVTDRAIMSNIAKRLNLAHKIGILKKKNHEKIIDKKREMELLHLHKKLAKKHRIDPEFVRKIFASMMKESKKIQK